MNGTNYQITNIAQSYSEKLASTGEWKHSDTPGYGENLAWRSFYERPNAKELMLWAIDSWYNETKDYKSFSETTGVTGHFTQIVWKQTSLLGMGISIRTSSEKHDGVEYVKTDCYITANYKVPGNVRGDEYHKRNVQPVPSKSEQECRRSSSFSKTENTKVPMHTNNVHEVSAEKVYKNWHGCISNGHKLETQIYSFTFCVSLFISLLIASQ